MLTIHQGVFAAIDQEKDARTVLKNSETEPKKIQDMNAEAIAAVKSDVTQNKLKI